MEIPILRNLSPTARTLYWYMRATSRAQSIKEIEARSGVPLKSIYMAAANYPEVFHKDKTTLIFLDT